MKTFWASWWTTKTSIATGMSHWITGFRGSPINDDLEYSHCAVFQAKSEDEVWHYLTLIYPDLEQRFCDEKSKNWMPPTDRFPITVEIVSSNSTT